MELLAGLSARVSLTVTEADTAVALGSGDVPVLATPRVLALAEAATIAAVTTALADGDTTVGTRVELEHRAPTPVGHTVVAEARLATVDGRHLVFDVAVRDGEKAVAQGQIERVVVNRGHFINRANGGG